MEGDTSVYDQVYADIADIDHNIVLLVRQRAALTGQLPDSPVLPGSDLPKSIQVDEVVDRFRAALGDPAELLARAILLVCRSLSVQLD